MIRYNPVLQFGRLVYSSQRQILYRNKILVMRPFSTSKNHQQSWNNNTERYLRTLNDYAVTLDKTFYEQISSMKFSRETEETVTIYHTIEDIMDIIKEGQNVSETLEIVQNMFKLCPTLLFSTDNNTENKSFIEDFGPIVNKSFKESIKNHHNHKLLIQNIENNLDKINDTR